MLRLYLYSWYERRTDTRLRPDSYVHPYQIYFPGDVLVIIRKTDSKDRDENSFDDDVVLIV